MDAIVKAQGSDAWLLDTQLKSKSESKRNSWSSHKVSGSRIQPDGGPSGRLREQPQAEFYRELQKVRPERERFI